MVKYNSKSNFFQMFYQKKEDIGMTKKRELYHCKLCGNVIEVAYAGATPLICCGEEMELLSAKSGEEGKEKHRPVVEASAKGILVKVGSIEHPMTDQHYIAFIEVLTATAVCRAELNPGDKPQAEFHVKEAEVLEIRSYCNVHGLWKN
jgi:superoxide reductase